MIKHLQKGLKERIFNHWKSLILMVLMILICALHARAQAQYVNFFPINGTFQNYNPVRRLLDGQIPFRDFQDYLGVGHLYLGSFITWLFGGSYRDSLFAFAFLSLFVLGMILAVAGRAVCKKKEYAIAIANILLILLLSGNRWMDVLAGNDAFKSALSYAVYGGNSARFLRGGILPVTVVLAVLALNSTPKLQLWQKLRTKSDSVRKCVLLGIIAGAAFVWSNDYGISCWLCLLVMSFWVLLSRERKLGNAALLVAVEAVCSVISVFILVMLVSLGHFGDWWKATFGTGSYQAWYYLSAKSYYLHDMDLSYLSLLQAGLCVFYLGKLFLAKGSRESIWRYGIPAYMNMCAFCAVNEYKPLSGGDSKEVALAVLFATVFFEVLELLSCVFRQENGGAAAAKKVQAGILAASMMIGLAWCGAGGISAWLTRSDAKDGIYFEELEGNMTMMGEDLNNAEAFLSGEKVFSTYASALETITGQFQPSGTDYIIHVLGDDARQQYLESFREEAFTYVATIRKEMDGWEYWVERANWFFYRELYRNYHPVYYNYYELFWERNEPWENNSITEEVPIEIEKIDEATYKVIVRTDPSVSGIADLYLDYEVFKDSGAVFQSMLFVENTGSALGGDDWAQANYLRQKSGEYVPVVVVDGYGELTLTSQPAEATHLCIREARCSEILTASVAYLIPEAAEADESGNVTVRMNWSVKNENTIKNAKYLVVGGEALPIQQALIGNTIEVSMGKLSEEQKQIIQNSALLKFQS